MKTNAVCVAAGLLLASIALVLAGGCARTSFDAIAEQQKLLHRDAEWADAASAGKDIDKIVSYWSDDALVIEPGQPIYDGKRAIRAYVAASLKTPGFKIHWVSEKPVFSADGTMAWMRGTDEMTVPGPDGALMTLHFRGVSIWRRDPDGAWRCVVDIANDPPATPSPAEPASAASAPTSAAFEPGRLERVEALRDPVIRGVVPTWYTPGFQDRARVLQRFMTGERAFVKRELGVDVRLSLAVLDPEQWKLVERQLPYPMPSVTGEPPVALMSADWASGPDFFPKQKDSDPALVRAVLAHGSSWDESTHRAMDLLGGHEVGHMVEDAYGIDPGTHWLNEFLANYVLYAYLQLDRRDQLWLYSFLQSFPHYDQAQPHVSLDDFESRYMQILTTDPPNYAWYQGEFMEFVQRVYAQQGVAFLRKVRAAFPTGHAGLVPDNAETLRRLEKISPGFMVWARAMDAKPRLVAQHSQLR